MKKILFLALMGVILLISGCKDDQIHSETLSDGTIMEGKYDEHGNKAGVWTATFLDGTKSFGRIENNQQVGPRTDIDERGTSFERKGDANHKNGTVTMKSKDGIEAIIVIIDGKRGKPFVLKEGNAFKKTIYVKYRGKITLTSYYFTGGWVSDSYGKVHELYYDDINQYMIILLNKTYYHYCGVGKNSWNLLYNSTNKYTIYENYFYGKFDCRIGNIPTY